MNSWHVQSPEFQFVNNADEHCNRLSTAWVREKNPERFQKRSIWHPNVSPSFQTAIKGQKVNVIKKKNNRKKKNNSYFIVLQAKKKNYTSLPSTSIHFCFDGMGKGKKRGGFGDRVGAWAGGALRQNLNISQQARPQMGKEWEAPRRERGREGWEGWERRSEAGDGTPEFFFPLFQIQQRSERNTRRGWNSSKGLSPERKLPTSVQVNCLRKSCHSTFDFVKAAGRDKHPLPPPPGDVNRSHPYSQQITHVCPCPQGRGAHSTSHTY